MTTTEDMFGPGGLYHRFTMGALIAASGDRIPVPICNDCGAVVIDVEAHRTACPRIKPERPEPLTYDQHAIAGIMSRHEPTTPSIRGGTTVGCRCNTHARFDGYAAWCGHVANAIATTLGGAR